MSTDNLETIISNPRPVARLIVKKGPQAGIIFPITSDRVVLGREDGCSIVVQDAEVSRRHTEIVWEDGTFIVQDLGSTNGSFLNGSQLLSPKPLQTGDMLGLGQSTFRFEIDTEEAEISESATPATLSDQLKSRAPVIGAAGCGCLIMACVCSTVGVVGLDLIGLIDLGLKGVLGL